MIDATKIKWRTLDTHYDEFEIRKTASQNKHLTDDERIVFNTLQTKDDFLLDVTLGMWKTKPKYIELQSDAKPYHIKLYPVSRSYEYVRNKELEQIYQRGVLKRLNISN